MLGKMRPRPNDIMHRRVIMEIHYMKKDEKNKWLYVVTQHTTDKQRVTSTSLHTRLVVMDAT